MVNMDGYTATNLTLIYFYINAMCYDWHYLSGTNVRVFENKHAVHQMSSVDAETTIFNLFITRAPFTNILINIKPCMDIQSHAQ